MRTSFRSGADREAQLQLFDAAIPVLLGTDGHTGLHPERVCQELSELRGRLLRAAVRMSDAGRMPIQDARSLGLNALGLRYAGSSHTEAKYLKEALRLFKFLDAHGVEYFDEITAEHIESFIWSASGRRGPLRDVTSTTASNRQSIVRALLRELEQLAVISEHDLIGPSVRRSTGEQSRLLTEDEIRRIRNQSEGGFLLTAAPLLTMLSEAGGTATEIAEVRGDDLDVDRGLVRFGGRRSRVGPLTDWGRQTLRVVLENQTIAAGSRVCCGDHLGPDRAAHTVTVGLHRILRDAGFRRDPKVSARSIRLTMARRVLDSEGLEAAARFLGADSLDAVARSLFYEWWVS